MTSIITSGGATVVDSGSVFSYEDKPIEITMLDGGPKGSTFKLKFSFSYDANDNAPKWILGKDNSDVCFHIELINFNNSLGTGMLSPIKVASNKLGISYYIVFMVHSWEKPLSKLFSYTIYRTDQSDENGGK